MIYVILGMHKSGTTLVSQMLHRSGINMGRFNGGLSYDRGNKYERETTKCLNRDLLNCGLANSLDIREPPSLTLTDAQRRQMQKIIQVCNKTHEDWGFKDPRTCFTYPLWLASLPEHKIVVIFRQPEELWRHYRPKRLRQRYQESRRAWKVIRAWYEHNLNIISFLQQSRMAYMVLNYGQLMASDNDLVRLQTFINRPLIDTRNPGLYRHKTNSTTLSLMLATWLATRKWGLSPSEVIIRLEELGQS